MKKGGGLGKSKLSGKGIKNTIVKYLKAHLKNMLIGIMIPVILIIAVGALVLGIIEEVIDKVGETISTITDFSTVDESDGAIIVNDVQVDTIINDIYEEGVNPEELWLLGDLPSNVGYTEEQYREALRKYIRKFYEAQLTTETLNYFHTNSTDAKTYGAIYVYRATSDNTKDVEQTGIKLTYIPYEQMKEYDGKVYQSTEAIPALNHFSIDPTTEQMIIAGTTRVKVEEGSASETATPSLTVTSDLTTVHLISIDYKSAVAKYTSKMEFLLYLTMISQNPEFVSAVTDLIKDSRINLVIMDNVSVNVNTNTYTYIQWRRTSYEFRGRTYYRNSDTPMTEITKITTTTTSPSANITYVKTWFCEQEIEYTRTTDPTIVDEPIRNGPWNEDPPTGEGSWRTDNLEVIENETTNSTYKETKRGQVKLDVGEKGDGKRFAQNQIPNPTFVGLMETGFDIPNSTRKAEAGTNLVSGADMLLYFLQKDPELETMELMMRYALNKYTGTSEYGDDFDSLYEQLEAEMIQTGGDYVVDITRSDSNIVITDEKVLEKALRSIYSGDRRTNLTAQVDTFIEMQNQYNVNAVFAIAVIVWESGGGTNWEYIPETTNNWVSIQGTYNGHSEIGKDGNQWKSYPSFREATLDFGNLISSSYFSDGQYTVNTIAPEYSGNTTAWASRISAEMTKIFNAAGIQTPTTGIGSGDSSFDMSEIVEGGVTSDAQADTLQSYIENELINTKEHTNGQYQTGNYAPWWTAEKGNTLEPFQCTWWVYGRASMYLEQTYGSGRYPTTQGNGGEYYDVNRQNGWFNYGNVPKPNSIISWTSGDYGHVAYVEGVTDGYIYISHAGYGDSWYGITKIPLNEIDGKYGKLNGYIYLDSPNGWSSK